MRRRRGRGALVFAALVGAIGAVAGCQSELTTTIVSGDPVVTIGLWVDAAGRTAFVDELTGVEAVFRERTGVEPEVRERDGGVEVLATVLTSATTSLGGLTGVGSISVNTDGNRHLVEVQIVSPQELLTAVAAGVGDQSDAEVLAAVTGALIDVRVVVEGNVLAASFQPFDGSEETRVAFGGGRVELRSAADEVVEGVLRVELADIPKSRRWGWPQVSLLIVIAGGGLWGWRHYWGRRQV